MRQGALVIQILRCARWGMGCCLLGMVMPQDRSTHKLLHSPVQLIPPPLPLSGLKYLWFPRARAGWEPLRQWDALPCHCLGSSYVQGCH